MTLVNIHEVFVNSNEERLMVRYEMAQLGSELGLAEGLFLLREKGDMTYQRLKQSLQTMADDQPLLLVFPPDQIVDASFADESVIRLGREIANGEFGRRCILLEGLTPDSLHNIEAAIHLQGLKLALIAVEPSGKWRVFGKLEPSLQEVLEILGRRHRVTTSELTDILGLAANTASNRLKRLWDQRLVRREYEVSEKGLQYIYHFWQWTL